MALKESDAIDNSGVGVKKSSRSKNARCSICLDHVAFNNDRSCVKLVCGHEFHLDCIGSAFNAKGAMMCPNCRNIEKGQWLYAVGCSGYEDPQDEDFYDLSYYEMSFGVRWCPFSSPPLEEADMPSNPYHDMVGHHPIFTEQPSFSSTSHPCPFFTYYGPVPLSSNSSGSHSDSSSFHNQWGGGVSGPGDMPGSYASPAMDPSYNIRDPHFPPLSAAGNQFGTLDQSSPVSQRASRTSNNIARAAGSFLGQSHLGHSSSARTGRPVTSSMIPPYPGSAARARDRVQALQAYSQPPNVLPQARAPMVSSTRRTSTHRAMVTAPASTSDPANSPFVFPSGTSNHRNSLEVDGFHAWERDYQLTSVLPPLNQADIESIWGPFHSVPSSSGSGSFRQRHWLGESVSR